MPRVKSFEEKYPTKIKTPEEIAAEEKRRQEIREKRRQAMLRAREKAMQNMQLRKEKKEQAKLALLNGAVNNLEKIIDEHLEKHSIKAIRASFLQAFELSGGRKALVQWIKENPRHRQEFYKMLTALIKQSDEELKNSGTKIVVNIMGLDNQNQEIVISDKACQITPAQVFKQELIQDE